jgi:hypothetical protein
VPSEKTPNRQLQKAILQNLPGVEAKDLAYSYSEVDLNGDRDPEIVTYLGGRYTCGSGGCTMMVFQPSQDYQLISYITLVNSPVIVSSESTAGWNDLVLYVAGGGIEPHYVRLQFDGRTYPGNPSVAPELAANTTVNGTVLLLNHQ